MLLSTGAVRLFRAESVRDLSGTSVGVEESIRRILKGPEELRYSFRYSVAVKDAVGTTSLAPMAIGSCFRCL